MEQLKTGFLSLFLPEPPPELRFVTEEGIDLEQLSLSAKLELDLLQVWRELPRRQLNLLHRDSFIDLAWDYIEDVSSFAAEGLGNQEELKKGS